MAKIHPTAVVHDRAVLGETAVIGPFCLVGENADIGEGVILHSHVVIEGRTTLGEGTEIYPFASIGHRPQDLKYQGEASELIIGKNNQIREHVTMNPGTEGGGMVTRVGDNGLFMMGTHVAHDCQIGNGVIMANNATLAGHVQVGDSAIIGGLSAVHQFVRIGAHAMIGGMSGIEQDVIPYGLAMGERAWLQGLNLVGMKRRGISREDIQTIARAFDQLFADEGTFNDRVSKLRSANPELESLVEILTFIEAESSRRLCQPKK